MTDKASVSLDAPSVARLGFSLRAASWRRLGAVRWEVAVGVLALTSAVAAFWITVRANFLAYPAWLAVQKADFILGPIAVGLYWRHRRPNNRLGLLLIALGVLGGVYILESATAPALFGIGVLCEYAIFLMTEIVILAFPNGRLEGRVVWLILALALAVGLSGLVFTLTSPQFAPGFTISGCRTVCPANGLAIWSPPSWTPQLADWSGYATVAVAFATACLLVWRFVHGTPPRRRALMVGAPIAVLFLLMQASYRMLFLFSPNGISPSAQPLQSVIQWTFAGARALVWYGFLFALIAAELFAGRAMRGLVRGSLGRPSLRRLEGMLRGPLGDPSLMLGFWRSHEWVDTDGTVLAAPGPGQMLTEVQRDGRPAARIVHDQQLTDDPELLQAAGAVALLALENSELETAWKASLRELADSRRRITTASDTERRKLERDLHDGAQQHLLGALLRLSAASERAGADPELYEKLALTGRELEEAIHELRDLAHGIYPTVLADHGLAGAIPALSHRFLGKVGVAEVSDRRFAPEVETAVYFCCLEAVQNASKHAGPDARTSIRVRANPSELQLEVRDNGTGFDATSVDGGIGLQSMRDRIGAVGGQLDIVSRPGRGTLLAAAVPLKPPGT